MTQTLAEAKAWLVSRADEGEDCPCCGQRAQLYHTPFPGAAARLMVQMYLRGKREWHHVPSIIEEKGGDPLKARHWGFIEKKPKAIRKDGSKRVGLWRLTEEGIAFVENRLRAPKWAYLFNSQCFGYDDSVLVSITDRVGKRFNYQELMQGF